MENGKYWYARTPERDAEFLRRFPQAKVGNGRLFSSMDGWSGNTINFTVKGDSVEVSPDGDTRDTTEFKPDVFPERYWFVNTPENVAEFKKRFPATKFMYGESMDKFFENRRDRRAFTYTYSSLVGGILAFCDSNPPQRTRFYFDNEKVARWKDFVNFDHETKPVEVPKVTGDSVAAPDKAKEEKLAADGWIKHTGTTSPLEGSVVAEVILRSGRQWTGVDARTAAGWEWGDVGCSTITHYRPVKDEAKGVLLGSGIGIKENSPFPESPLAAMFGPQIWGPDFRAHYISFGSPVSVSDSKESSMSTLSDSEVQRIAAAIVKMQSPASSGETSGPGILRRAGGYAWGATKGALGWTFAPAAKWAQTVVFLTAIVGLLFGGYKTYSFVRSIQLPSIVWPESSPSDVVTQPAPTESLTSWLNEQSGT